MTVIPSLKSTVKALVLKFQNEELKLINILAIFTDFRTAKILAPFYKLISL